ncbi:hypothetical protein RJ640_005697 [Escallonia rubra]|uniref:RING-type domain-containing protein n=1 Tax=Escallonia rubra TaxID=112253 RepID=A0AA88RYS0_9ASTE|nr:hypothetical protein RJ640_005697 [Escallonia rubra]
MSQLGDLLVLGLQNREARSIVEFLREKMNGLDRVGRRKSFKERLGFTGMGCCGATLGLRPSFMGVREEEDEEGPVQQIEVIDVGRALPENVLDPDCLAHTPVVGSSMNLATALAAERHYRAAQDSDGVDLLSDPSLGPGPDQIGPNDNGPAGSAPGTPLRVSLMRLLEESDGVDGEMEKERGGAGWDTVCCVCMRRKKGAAFIPCGHTFCRVCSRELWLNRGSCPLCNRPISEILDIF